MGADEHLGGALRGAAGELPHLVGDWDDVRVRARRRRRRRQFTSAAVLVVMLVAVASAVIVFRSHSTTHRSVIATPPTAGEEVLAAFRDRLEVLSASDGRVLRTLVEGSEAAGASTVTPTPDGVWVYFGRGTPTCGDQTPTIWRVPTGGGPVERVAAGWAPRVSPDGRFLAYASLRPASRGCDQANVLVVDDLTGGTEQQLDYGPDIQGVTPLAWSPDSTRLVTVTPPTTYGQVDVTPSGLRQLDPPHLPPGNGALFLSDGELVTSLPTQSSTRIVSVDATTGNTTRTLAEIGTPLFLIAADSSDGRFLLTGPLADRPDGHDLYRGSIGQPAPTKLASNVRDATWLPAHAGPKPPPTSEPTVTSRPHRTQTEPATITAHAISPIRDGYKSQVVELASRDGHVEHTLADVPDGIVVYAATADRESVYVDAFDGSTTCPGQAKTLGSVLRVPRKGGEPAPEANGFRPALSPDGAQLAYLRADCGEPSQPFVPKRLAIRQLATGKERVWPLPPPYADGNAAFENVGPFAWDADGTHLLMRVVSDGHTAWWYVDTTKPIASPDAIPLGIPDSPDGPLDIIALGRADRWAALMPGQNPGDPLRIVEYRPIQAATGRDLTTIQPPADTTVHLVDADASGEHLLLIVTENGTQTSTLYGWSPGEAQPREIAQNSVAADW
jgi:dipeptidyl aminopeptidase/acylaminoacyl peptidase